MSCSVIDRSPLAVVLVAAMIFGGLAAIWASSSSQGHTLFERSAQGEWRALRDFPSAGSCGMALVQAANAERAAIERQCLPDGSRPQ
jgi:hypothetical protein